MIRKYFSNEIPVTGMVLESLPVLSTAYLMVIAGFLLLIAGYYYRESERARYILGAGAVLITFGVLLVAYFISSFG